MRSRALRWGAGLGLAGATLGAVLALAFLRAPPPAASPAERFPSPPPAPEAVRAGADLRVSRLEVVPTSGRSPARLHVTLRNVGTREATGVGYVLQDGGVVVAYEETALLAPGEAERQGLAWTPTGGGAHELLLTVGDGNVKWVQHRFVAAVRGDAGPNRVPARSAMVATLAAGAAGLGAGIALARRRG